ncbi:hypothetical protein HMSSN036_71830 [Paenibacillus macerans]|nr:hypothetical protein HMSSN036_71830 [Paenibacillus macerans]
MRTIRGLKLSYVFQDYQGSFTPFRTIAQHFEEYQKTHGNADSRARNEAHWTRLLLSGWMRPCTSGIPFS